MIAVETLLERWELNEPFATARDSITHIPVLVVTLTGRDGKHGWAEAAGVDYDGETPASMAAQIDAVRGSLRDEITGDELLRLLPAGGARNALDCALWDLRAKESGVPVWRMAGLSSPCPVTTAFTIGLGSAADIRRKARDAREYGLIKLKVDHERHMLPAAGGATLALRVPAAAWLRGAHRRNSGKPLLSTSVNRAGNPAAWRVADIIAEFGSEVDLVLDGGDLPVAEPSTIVDASSRPFRILRQGAFRIPPEELR